MSTQFGQIAPHFIAPDLIVPDLGQDATARCLRCHGWPGAGWGVLFSQQFPQARNANKPYLRHVAAP